MRLFKNSDHCHRRLQANCTERSGPGSRLPLDASPHGGPGRQDEVPQLIDPKLEEGLAHLQIVVPHALELGRVGLRVLTEEGLRVDAPRRECLGVVVAKIMEVLQDEVVLDRGRERGEGRDDCAGEDVLVQEGVACRDEVRLADRVHDGQPVGLQQLLDALEEALVVLEAHVLEHADAVDTVVGAGVGRVFAVVAVVLPDEVQLRLCKVGLRPLHLLLAEGDAGDAHLAVLVHVRRRGAPAHAEVRHLHARLQLELAQDEVELVLLRLVQRLRVLPVGAGVGHGGAQHALVEVVAGVVVLLRHPRGALPRLLVEEAPGQQRRGADGAHDQAQVVLALLAARADGRAVEDGQEERQRIHMELPRHVALRNAEVQLRDDVVPGRLILDLDVVPDGLRDAAQIDDASNGGLSNRRLLQRKLQEPHQNRGQQDEDCTELERAL
mmetsp:Transcript_45771/g.141941  ORF Transcript_45771/g.141941 Transcript_45771/m.141941 type:complete len:439 (-) Transcript_45771:126-1442(-)